MPDKQPRWRRFQTMKARRRVITRSAKKAEGATLRHAHRFLVKRWDNVRDVRRRILTWMIGVSILIVIVGVQILWFQRSYLQQSAVSGGTYAEGVLGPVDTLNPLFATSDAEIATNKLIFSSLFNYDATGSISSDLAKNMQLDPTGKIYTVAMRPGVVWHDGRKVTAKDVVFTVGLMKDPAVRSAMNASWKDIEVSAVDDYTVRFTLPAAYAAFPQALTFSVLPEHVLANVDRRQIRQNTFSSSPVGSGPFSFRLSQSISDRDKRKIIHMAANKRYYAGEPKLERFQMHIYGSMDDIGVALRTGEIGSATDISSDIARGIDESRYDIRSKPINSGVYAIINTTQPALRDVNVRKALQLATDTDKLRATLYDNPPKLQHAFVDGQLTGDNLPVVPATDIAKAMTLLDAAGWTTGPNGVRTKDGQPLKLQVVTRKNSDYEKALELISGQWQKIGVDVEKRIVDPSAVDQSFAQTVLQPRSYDVLIDELSIGGDPDVFAYWHTQGRLNFSNYSSTASDDALVSGRSRSDELIRNGKYRTFATQWISDVPAIGLYQSTMIYAQSKQIQSISDDVKIISPSDRYVDVQYWTAEKGSVYKTP